MFFGAAQSQTLPLRRGLKILPATSPACRIQRIASHDAFQYQRGVSGASNDWTNVIEARRQRKNTMNADPAKGGLETYNAAQRGWNANGSARIAADSSGAQTRSYGRRGSSARSSRDPVCFPRISYRTIVRVLRSHPISKFMQICLAEHDRAGATQFPNYGGIFGRQKVPQDK